MSSEEGLKNDLNESGIDDITMGIRILKEEKERGRYLDSHQGYWTSPQTFVFSSTLLSL